VVVGVDAAWWPLLGLGFALLLLLLLLPPVPPKPWSLVLTVFHALPKGLAYAWSSVPSAAAAGVRSQLS
jgi:hypothetical protein